MKLLNKDITPTIQQIEAIKMVKENRLSVLTGKPGTGKTFATKLILEWAESENLNITQCAPTGKAAKRMIESTGFPSKTIHSTLQCQFDKGQFIFVHNQKNPLPYDLLIVDEVSMVDNWLMARLLEAVDSNRTRVLLIGDYGQLESIGPGAILQDLIQSGKVPVTELDIIHRNSGKIVEACAMIHGGKVYHPDTALNLEADNKINLIHVNSSSHQATVQAIRIIVSERMPVRGYDPIWDVQTISPVNEKTDLSCKNLNKILQDKLNPGQCEDKLIFRVGDKVINTKNEKVKKTDNRDSYIVNGDMGKVIEIDKKFMVVEFFEPTRTVKLSRAMNNLLLAYAVTGHRMQGSESPVIIIPVDKAFSYMFGRKWLYTAISRAKDICITVGDFGAIEKMIRNNTKIARCTMLKERIQESFVNREKSGGCLAADIDFIKQPEEEFFDI